jgi:hypothetical protein
MSITANSTREMIQDYRKGVFDVLIRMTTSQLKHLYDMNTSNCASSPNSLAHLFPVKKGWDTISEIDGRIVGSFVSIRETRFL